jgi:integrase/recombinase XerD
MVHLKTIFDTRRQKSDGTYPITFRVIDIKKVYYLPSGISIQKEYWLDDTRQVKKSHPNALSINTNISEQYYKIQKAILSLEMSDGFSFDELKELLNPVKKPKPVISFYDFTQELIVKLRSQKKNGNATVYCTAINRLVKYKSTKEIAFSDITYDLLISFNDALLEEGVKVNSISNYFRALRAIYNKGTKAKLTDRSNSPFYDFSIKLESTRKRAITKHNVQRLICCSYPESSAERDAINYFLISFYLIGMSFTDLAYLKQNNIQDGRLIFKRRKTHKWYNIKLFSQVTDIIYQYYPKGNTFLLPILPNDIEEDTLTCKKIINQWIKTTNKYLKRIGKSLQIEMELTTYVSRHSWATIAKKLGYSNELIAEALGHSFGNRVTNIYLEDFDKEMVDKMHQKVIS